MSENGLALGPHAIRGTDSNSLLRLYDLARDTASQSPLQLKRAQADRALRRIARELRKRNVPF